MGNSTRAWDDRANLDATRCPNDRLVFAGYSREREMALYRWATVVLTGPWRPSREQAMQDALASGQAKFVGGNVTLRSFVSIEQLRKDRNRPDGRHS
jgi:hypothetical protein